MKLSQVTFNLNFAIFVCIQFTLSLLFIILKFAGILTISWGWILTPIILFLFPYGLFFTLVLYLLVVKK